MTLIRIPLRQQAEAIGKYQTRHGNTIFNGITLTALSEMFPADKVIHLLRHPSGKPNGFYRQPR